MEDQPFCIYISPRRPLKPVASHFPYYIICPVCNGSFFIHPDFKGGFSDVTCFYCNTITTIEELFRRMFEPVSS